MLQSLSSIAVALVAPTSLLIHSPSVNPEPLFAPSRPLLIAHQDVRDGTINGRLHLDPDDSPFAGQPSLTWFHLYSGNDAITLANCNCNLLVYDAQNQQVAKPELSETEMEGHRERPITASITFPKAGTYQVVLTGQPKAEGEFQPFRIAVPIVVRP
ncbi:hypothetical protein [Leptolyngbya ohadii]|uniref:hypothetical protein n=1 Tax=Leptolyngbya ohadii TaxID=1962290 RepID=UPI000B5A0333|nr:hypothetical protein [Leptolyngbya ohadii]